MAETLPQDIITSEICTRLPAKVVGRFRCVSKHWCSQLSHPRFIKDHLAIHAHKYEEEKLICISHRDLHTLTLENNCRTINFISRKLHFEQLSAKLERVVGSCNGLVLVEDEKYMTYLINPTTLQYHRIPILHPDGVPRSYALGYDSDSDDYKVVALSKYDYKYEDRDSCTTYFDVYYVKKGLWKRLENPIPHYYHVGPFAYGVPLNGALHWVAQRMSHVSSVIVAFDLSKEEFKVMWTPTTRPCRDIVYENLVALRGLLCLCHFKAGKVHIWIKKDYEKEKSWTRVKLDTCGEVVCLVREKYVLLEDLGELSIYDMKRHEQTDLRCGASYSSTTFIESLISPKFAVEN